MWKGPYLEISSRPPIYKVRTRKKEKYIHHDNLKSCQDRNIPLWLRRARHRLWNKESHDAEPVNVEESLAGQAAAPGFLDLPGFPVSEETSQEDESRLMTVRQRRQ